MQENRFRITPSRNGNMLWDLRHDAAPLFASKQKFAVNTYGRRGVMWKSSASCTRNPRSYAIVHFVYVTWQVSFVNKMNQAHSRWRALSLFQHQDALNGCHEWNTKGGKTCKQLLAVRGSPRSPDYGYPAHFPGGWRIPFIHKYLLCVCRMGQSFFFFFFKQYDMKVGNTAARWCASTVPRSQSCLGS